MAVPAAPVPPVRRPAGAAPLTGGIRAPFAQIRAATVLPCARGHRWVDAPLHLGLPGAADQR